MKNIVIYCYIIIIIIAYFARVLWTPLLELSLRLLNFIIRLRRIDGIIFSVKHSSIK